jgi:hypothetical protein
VKRRAIQRGLGQQLVRGANFRLMDNVGYVQDRAVEHDSRVVTLPQLLLFSTQTGTPGCSILPSIWPFRLPAIVVPCRCVHRGDGEEHCHWLDGNLPNRRQVLRLL